MVSINSNLQFLDEIWKSIFTHLPHNSTLILGTVCLGLKKIALETFDSRCDSKLLLEVTKSSLNLFKKLHFLTKK